MLVLALLTERESYGYELVTRLQEVGLTDITAGTVYPVLTRLEREGQVSSRLVASPSGPARKYYRPTPDGDAALTAAGHGWQRLSRTVATVLTSVRAGGGPAGRHEPTVDQEPVGTTPPDNPPVRQERT